MSNFGLKYKLQTSRFFWRFYRFYSTDAKYMLAKILPLNPFKSSVTIWPTTTCNAACVFCSKRKIKLYQKTMGMKTYMKSVDEIKKMGRNVVGLNPIIGDVLIDENLIEKIKYAKNKGMYVSFFTNGILLLKNEKYKKIIDAGADEITISVGDVDEVIDSKIFGITEEISRRRWEGIFKLLQYAEDKKSPIKIDINFRPARPPYKIVRDKKFENLNRFSNFTAGFLFCYDNWTGKVTKNDLSGIMKFKKGFEKNGVCRVLYNAVILPDGKVRLCNCRIKDTENDELIVGDIKTSSLTKIIDNKKANEIRENFSRGIYPEVCEECTFYKPLKK